MSRAARFRSLPLVAVVIAGCTASPAAAAAFTKNPFDAYELQTMRARRPHAAELFDQAEALTERGALDQAGALYHQAGVEDPEASVSWRRHCEVMTALGHRPEAVGSCGTALQVMRSNVNVRAMVNAFVDGAPMSLTDLFQALNLTNIEREKAPGQPVPVAALFHIAERTGDVVMMKHSADELLRIAPADPETVHALGVMSAMCPPWRFWAGWGAIVAALLATLGHAAWRLVRKRGRAGAAPAAAAAAVLCAVQLCVVRAGAEESPPKGWLSTWPVDDSDPDKSIPTEAQRNAEPLNFGYWLQDLIMKAEIQSKRGNHEAAAKFYSTLARAAPDRAVGFLKACEEFEASGKLQAAINACGGALLREGLTVKDYTHFVGLVLSKPGPMTARDEEAIDMVLEHMKKTPQGHAAALQLECDVGLRTSNVAKLQECTTALAAEAPDSPKTLTFQWSLAMMQGNFDDAAKIIERAKATGMKADGVASMDGATRSGARRQQISWTLACVAVLVLLAAAAVWARAAARKRAETSPA